MKTLLYVLRWVVLSSVNALRPLWWTIAFKGASRASAAAYLRWWFDAHPRRHKKDFHVKHFGWCFTEYDDIVPGMRDALAEHGLDLRPVGSPWYTYMVTRVLRKEKEMSDE